MPWVGFVFLVKVGVDMISGVRLGGKKELTQDVVRTIFFECTYRESSYNSGKYIVITADIKLCMGCHAVNRPQQ